MRHNEERGLNLSTQEFLEGFIKTWAGKGLKYQVLVEARELATEMSKLKPEDRQKVKDILKPKKDKDK